MALDYPPNMATIDKCVPTGGSAGQVLAKKTGANYDTQWINASSTGVTSFNGRTGAITPQASDYTPTLIGAVPATRTVDGKALSGDITILPTGGTAGQVLTKSSSTNYAVQWSTPASTGVTSFKSRTGAVTPQSGDYTASMVGARADTWTPTASQVGAIPVGSVYTIELTTESGYESSTKTPTTLYLIPEE